MKLQNQNIKSNILKKIFIKICRKLDFEIIDQANLHLPVMNKGIKNNLSKFLKCNKNLINIKGKTADDIGIFGKSEAIGCWATINLIN